MSEWGDKLLTEVDNARLRAENDKLRVELTDLRLKSCPSCGIKVENEELRELIRHMRCCFNREYTEYGVDFIATRCEDCEYDNASGRCDFDNRMAELGVEVES